MCCCVVDDAGFLSGAVVADDVDPATILLYLSITLSLIVNLIDSILFTILLLLLLLIISISTIDVLLWC